MQTIVGPVVVTKEAALGSICGRLRRDLAAASPIEYAYHARKFEIRSRTQCLAGAMTACSSLDEFASALARQ